MPRTGPRRPYVPVRLDPEQLERIDALAAEHDLNRSEVVRKLIDWALPDGGHAVTS